MEHAPHSSPLEMTCAALAEEARPLRRWQLIHRLGRQLRAGADTAGQNTAGQDRVGPGAALLLELLGSASGVDRVAALAAIGMGASFERRMALLRQDRAPLVRRRVVAVSDEPAVWWAALDDPVWRVRRAGLRRLVRHAGERGARSGSATGGLTWFRGFCSAPERAPALERGPWPGVGAERRARAIRFGLHQLGGPPGEDEAPAEAPWTRWPCWDPDPAVFVEAIRHLPEAALRALGPELYDLVALPMGYPLHPWSGALSEWLGHRARAERDPACRARIEAWVADPRIPDVGVLLAPPSARREEGSWFRLPRARRRPVASGRLELPAAGPHTRLLGGDPVPPLIISGRYGLPPEACQVALEAGATAWFWEPDYRRLTEWLLSLPRGLRRSLALVGGSFASRPDEVRRDLESMLGLLELDRVTAWILFWSRSQARLSDEVAEMLFEEQARGRIGTFGFSTHDRGLARRGLEDGWPLVMVRHSAAHRGAEALFPLAQQQGAAVLTFSCLTYGRVLTPRDGRESPFGAADAYRYCLSQPGVRAALSAPSTLAQLQENLAVLRDPVLSAQDQQALIRWCQPVRAESRMLRQLLRDPL